MNPKAECLCSEAPHPGKKEVWGSPGHHQAPVGKDTMLPDHQISPNTT